MASLEGRTAVFIDGHSTYFAVKALNFDMDYKRLLAWLDEEFGPILRATYYTTVSDEENIHQDIVPLLDFLQYNGFSICTKPIKVYDEDERRTSRRGDVNVEISVDMLLTMQHVDNIVLFSGDANLKKAIQAVQQNGCRVFVISTNETKPKIVSDELRRFSDEFIELSELVDFFQRGVAKPVLVNK